MSQDRCDFDLDGLASGELVGSAEMQAREHLRGCPACRTEHELLLRERRTFVARAAHVSRAKAAPLPDFDALLARAAAEPVGLAVRWQSAVRTWSAVWRGTVARSVLAVSAVGLIVHVAWPEPPSAQLASQPNASLSAQASHSLPEAGSTSASWDGADSAACEDEVCVDQLFAATPAMTPVFRVNADACSSSTSQSTFTTVDWSSQKSSSNELDNYVDAVCIPDAI